MLRRAGLRGAIVYHDGVEDDARLTVAVARTAMQRDAVAVTRLPAVGSVTDASGRVVAVRARDVLPAPGGTGAEIEIRADHVVDARGVWAAQPDGPFGGEPATIVPSRGTHLVVPRERIPVASGMTLRIPGRVLFLIPWPHAWLIGTTDDPDTGSPDHPAPNGHDVRAILDLVNRTLELDLTAADAVGAYTGLRPLVAGKGASSTVTLSREHRVWTDPNGVVRVGGGKYTTYRLIARDAVDAALGHDARRRRSHTDETPVIGAAPVADLERLADAIAADQPLSREAAGALVMRHGTEARRLLAAAPSQTELLSPDADQVAAEACWAVREELALTLDDILARRMRLATVLRDRAASIASQVAALVGPELRWSPERQAAEVAAYLESAHREYDVPRPE